ncbi:hydrogenase subunit MbhD domain-containing protein [Proteinivorax hydrogeniformans]|uniref:Hydrogenase subunit MbhD domain-containing protein n=2 Tax=Proteinivorax TaxID=1491776 RepID=A0AAU7VK94_9FIRM
MLVLNVVLILFLICCALAVERTKDLLSAVVIFGAYSVTMAVLWLLLKAPDIALTEAAMGAGVTTMLFVAVISRTRRTEK